MTLCTPAVLVEMLVVSRRIRHPGSGTATACSGRLGDDYKAGSEFGELFDELVVAYAKGFINHVKEDDCNWFDKIDQEHADVEKLRQYSKYCAPYSKHEFYFGLYKYMYEKGAEVREDIILARRQQRSRTRPLPKMCASGSCRGLRCW
jgi:hypothetical protein